MMRKLIITLIALFLLIFTGCSSNQENSEIVGKWQDAETGIIIEYSSDGHYYEYVNENFTTDKTSYKISNKKITYYIEGEEDSEFSVEYKIDGDKLIIGSSIEYVRLTGGTDKVNEKSEQE